MSNRKIEKLQHKNKSITLFLIIKDEPQEKSLNLRFVWFVNSKSVPIVLKWIRFVTFWSSIQNQFM